MFLVPVYDRLDYHRFGVLPVVSLRAGGPAAVTRDGCAIVVLVDYSVRLLLGNGHSADTVWTCAMGVA
jgi:hypothetical protein